jgi:hypothetical protein
MSELTHVDHPIVGARRENRRAELGNSKIP